MTLGGNIKNFFHPLKNKLTNVLFIERGKKMTLEREKFISENKSFIYKVASSICKRKLEWENDDELSIALIAFNKSIDTYNEDKGNFFSYAKMLIKNALIDYFRKQSKTINVYLEDEELISFEQKVLLKNMK